MTRKVVFLLLVVLVSFSCGRKSKNNNSTVNDSTIVVQPSTFNFFVENSGSMKGFFSGNGQSQLETIINEYYDRLYENKIKGDTITLNYVNTSVERYKYDLKKYLKDTKSKCTAQYTKIDDILKMAMDSVGGNNVNIVISDYCFESNDGSLSIAKSRITRLFTEQINSNRDLSVALFKYMVNFHGKYYPGGFDCNRPMPIYIWVFGNTMQVKRVAQLNIESQNCGKLLLQIGKTLDPKIEMKAKRSVKDGEIIVSEWDVDRQSKKYFCDILVDLSEIILDKEDLLKVSNYIISSSSSAKYTLESITKEKDFYKIRIATEKPAPGTLEIAYKIMRPDWIDDYSFEGAGLPKDSTTYGIKYLIGGVYDAFYNKSNKYFNINITLK